MSFTNKDDALGFFHLPLLQMLWPFIEEEFTAEFCFFQKSVEELDFLKMRSLALAMKTFNRK